MMPPVNATSGRNVHTALQVPYGLP
jgi:hypothetical protein